MSYQLEFTNEAIANLEKLTQVVQVRVVKKINWLVENFELITPQSLAADLSGFYKLRVGDYRVIYSFDDSNIIVVHQIGHRREIYNL
jgi:mRNA interferase RelE/StbE